MKKIIIIFIGLILCLFCFICYMVFDDKRYINEMENEIISNTDIQDVDYINKYDDNYIVMDSDYVYLISNNYKIVFKIELSKLHENKNDYDIIYKDEELMYFNDKYIDGELVYEYYDLYTYQIKDTVMVGGN